MRTRLLLPLIVSAAFIVAPAIADASTATASEAPASSNVSAGSFSPALTAGDAEQVALDYAAETWGNEPRLEGCDKYQNKEKAGEVQWYCYGYFLGGPKTWWVKIGPYGKVLESYRS